MLDDLIREEMIREEMAKVPKPKPTDNLVTARDVVTAAKPMALPLLGNVAGTVAGALSGPMAPAAVPTLEALGGMAGEFANQTLGITEPSNTAIALQGIIPPAIRGAAALKRVAPGATAGAKTLNEIAPLEAQYQLDKVAQRVPERSTDFFSKAQASGKTIPTKDTFNQLMDEYTNVLQGSSGDDLYKGTREYLERLGNKLSAKGDALTPSEYQKELRDLSARINGAEGRRLNQVEFGSLNRIKDKLITALDSAPAGSDLSKARHLYQRERVMDDLDEMTFKADKTLRGQGDSNQFNAAEVLRKIEKDEKFSRRFKAAFDPTEQKEILGIYRKLNDIPSLAPASGTNAGSMRVIQDMRQGLMAGGAAQMMGASPGVVAGVGMAGAIARPMVDSAKVFSMAMQTHEGRKLLMNELTVNKNKPLREILEKVAVGMSSTETAGEGIREFTGSTVHPFPNER